MRREKTKAWSIMVVEDSEEHLISAIEAFGDRRRYNLKTFDGYTDAALSICMKTKKSQYDIVLTDYMLPYFGSEKVEACSDYRLPRPFGLSLAMQAAHLDVKYIAVVSLGNHHEELDIHGLEYNKGMAIFTVNKSKLLITSRPPSLKRKFDGRVLDSEKYFQDGDGNYLIKDWAKVLEMLITENE